MEQYFSDSPVFNVLRQGEINNKNLILNQKCTRRTEMSHYNLVHEMNPETISEENHKKIAKHRILLNNKVD